jgi:hypothetical protein
MAQEDDDADKLPPLGDDTAKYLEDAKKGKPRSFLLVCKGAKIRYLALALSWSRVLFHRETKPGRRRSGPGPEKQIPIPKFLSLRYLMRHRADLVAQDWHQLMCFAFSASATPAFPAGCTSVVCSLASVAV